MDYSNAVAYLYALQKHGIKLGLENTARLLSLLDDPQNSFRSIHIAGTNGKGSTSAMIASILQAAGFRVGLFTSPHLVSFTERIRVNGEQIEEQEVVGLAEEIRGVIEHSGGNSAIKLNPTFFEFVTAMAFLYFKRSGVEWAVVETGMGGRLDATNVLIPSVSVITGISLDHREFLGGTLREIAAEKAGIIKGGIPVVSSRQEPEAEEVIREKAAERGAPLFMYGSDFLSRLLRGDMHGVTFGYEGQRRFGNLYAPLCGVHQMENASIAVRAIEVVQEQAGISDDAVASGLARAKWPGRLELVAMDENREILIDGAHNPSASRTLAEAVTEYFLPFYGKVVLILGIMADKDIEGIMKPLLPLSSEAVLTTPGYERAASPLKLSDCASSLGFPRAKIAATMREAIETAKDLTAGPGGGAPSGRSLIIITGSFYTIGEAKTVLGEKGILTRLRE